MHQCNVRRKQFVNSEFDDGVCLAAADFHDGPGLGYRVGNGAGDACCGGGISILIHKAHEQISW
jgi:hypothetical protein